MVPLSSGTPSALGSSKTEAPSTTRPSATESPPSPAQSPNQNLSPQERKRQKLQQRLEQSIAAALPEAAQSRPNGFPSGFIVSLEPSSNGQELAVILNNAWYQLDPGEQEAIAIALWNQRDTLKFQQLTLKDPQGKTTARNPVVGDQMVILRR